MPSYIWLALMGLTLVLGGALGMRWERGEQAIAHQELKDKLREQAEREDKKGVEHAETLEKLNRQLGDARRAVYGLTAGRDCLSARAVGVLNGIGLPATGAATSEPARAPEAAATDRDVGDALAICRAEHEKLAGQLNDILDIEERRTRGTTH